MNLGCLQQTARAGIELERLACLNRLLQLRVMQENYRRGAEQPLLSKLSAHATQPASLATAEVKKDETQGASRYVEEIAGSRRQLG